jgi:hypothetical protein
VVLKKAVPEGLPTQLEEEKIFSCSRHDPNGKPELQYNTFLVLQVAVVFNAPTTYVLRRSCSISYEQDGKLPMSLSIEAVPVVRLGDNSTSGVEPEILVIREAGSLILLYDTEQADQVNQNEFAQLVQKMREKEIELGIDCVVLNPEDISIGGSKRFRVKTLQEPL